MIGNLSLEFLLEKNIQAANIVGNIEYNKVLNEEFGIECNTKPSDEKFLEYKFRLDKSVCQ